MRICFAVFSSFLLLLGCQQAPPEEKLTTVLPGSDYAEVKASLLSHGLKEETDQWDIAYPDSQQAYTYFLKQDVALVLFVEKTSGNVLKLAKCEKADQPKSARNWTDLDTFNIDRELPKNETALSPLTSIASGAVSEECPECEQSDLVRGSCFRVAGELQFYNGWPPFLRIEPEHRDTVYGVGPVENELVPVSVRAVMPTMIEGNFELCPFNESTSVPYDDRVIQMVCIKSVSDAWYWDGDTGERKRLQAVSESI